MKFNHLLLFALLLFAFPAFSQNVFLRSGTISPAQNISQHVLDSFAKANPPFANTRFAVIQFAQLPSAEDKNKLQENGIELLDYLPQNAYRVAIKKMPPANLLERVKANALFSLTPQQKMHDYFATGFIPSWAVQVAGTVDVWISFYKTLDTSLVLQELKALNVDILSTGYLSYQIISLRIAANRIPEIAALPFVEYLQPAPPKAQPLNYNSRTGARANVLNTAVANGGRGLNGEGITIGHGDNADLQDHFDFTGRLINRNASPFNAHGVHTAGIMAGAGNIIELYRGYAPKATIISQAFDGILNNAATYVNDYGMVITNNSYGNIIECEYNGTYDLTARMLDQQALDLPNLLHVFAAGNSGLNTCFPYPTTYRTVLGGYQSAKNVVTVGSTTDSGLVANSSSRGPVKDGRLKPDIVAMGQGVISTWPTNSYASNNGTSMAAPAVSGGLALLYQRYRQLHGSTNPKNGLMKALLCNGASDRGLAGPDFYYGFGWMNLLRSVEMLEASHYFNGSSTNGGITTHAVAVPVNTAELKVLLYWNDLPASVISTKNLVNDLDLEVVDPSGNTVLPKVLDTTIASLGKGAFNGADHVNNMEQVVISNPVPGNYTLRVKGTTVTNAQQEYFLAYDPVPVQLKLTTPAGDMALVPGEKTKISWDSYGLSGTGTLEFSPDSGATWTTIAASVDVSRAVYTWTVPDVTTTSARVRITKAGSGETSVGNLFAIIGQPSLSFSAVQCEGYISLGWSAVQGATDYEVMILRGDEMKPVATTTATTYTFSNLSKDSVYLVTVRARRNGKPGRRAVAFARQPNSGTCAGSISDNDVKMDGLLSPRSGRKGTTTELSNPEIISVRIKNLDDAPVSNFTVGYILNGGVPVVETVTTPVAAGSTFVYNFSTTANFSSPANYILTLFVKNAGDQNAANDTLTVVVKQLANDPISLTTVFLESMETAKPASYEQDTTGLAGIERFDFGRTTGFGRVRTFVNTGMAYAGTNALTLDASRFVLSGNSNNLYGTFNLVNYSAAATDVRLDFRYMHHGQFSNPQNRVWVRGSDTQPWIQVYDLDAIGVDEGLYKKTSSIELSNLLATNTQNFSSSFQVRWGQWGQWPATDKNGAAGYTIDDIRLYQVTNDVQLLRVDSPATNNCSLSPTAHISVTVRNSSNAALTNVPVRYRINNGLFVTETIPLLPAKATVQYSFATTANLSAFGAYTIQAVADLNSDTFRENDTAARTVYNQPVVNTFPYLQNFEKDNGNFYTDGSRSSWAYGTPNSRLIKSAASGAKAWKTSLQGMYNDKERSYLYSPCFDLTGLTAPTLSFSMALDIEDCGTAICDAAWVEYSTDGVTWQRLGSTGSGTNWYNKGASQNVWSIQNYTWWHVATQALPVGSNRLRLRFVMASDGGVSREGIAIDDIHIYDNNKGIYDGPTLSAPITQNLAGNNWTDFASGGKLIASIQPGNQAIGTTGVQAYSNNGAVRFTNNQYYLDRNIAIKPATTHTDSALVRLYFLDKEVDSLLKAKGCPACAKPASAYELGVTQYSDPDTAIENGSLADNQQGLWKFFAPAQVTKVPFDKGYYAEFKVADFSEFWLNSGGADLMSSLPVKLMNISVSRRNEDVLVTWKVGSETDVLRYEVELARGADALQAGRFERLGEVASLGNTSAARDYRFLDAEASKFGTRYYRLKIINSDGSVRYSPVRAVVFADAVLWQVYPNPSKGLFALVYQFTAGETVSARVYDAKGSLVKEISSTATGFLQKLNVDLSANNYATGIYLLRIRAGNKEQAFKLYKQ